MFSLALDALFLFLLLALFLFLSSALPSSPFPAFLHVHVGGKGRKEGKKRGQ